MTTLEEINDFTVKPLPIPPLPALEKIKGSELFGMLYKNCFICAPKNSGKTQALSNILLHVMGLRRHGAQAAGLSRPGRLSPWS